MKATFFAVLPMVLALSVHAQEADANQTPTSDVASAPPTLVGQQAQTQPLSELNGSNYLTGGIAITQVYTDNAELSSAGRVHDLSYDLEPNLTLSHAATRLSYSLGVFAGFVVNRTLNERNQASQTARLDVSYRMAQFTTLRFSERFSNTTGLWSGSGAGAGYEPTTGIGALQQPNSALYTFGQFRTNIVLGELSHQFTLNGVGGVRGTQSFTWFPDAATSPVVGSLYGGQTYSAEAFYNYRFNPRQWIGATLRGQRFDLDRSMGRTDTLSSIFLYGFSIQPNMSLSFFAGPELSTTAVPQESAPPIPSFSRRMWTPTAGAVFNMQNQRTSATASYVRGMNDSAGLSSAVTLSTASATITRQLARFWGFGVNFSYSRGEPIVPSQAIRTYSGSLQLISHLTSNITVTGGYGRDENAALASGARASADRVWISFLCSFLRPLGR